MSQRRRSASEPTQRIVVRVTQKTIARIDHYRSCIGQRTRSSAAAVFLGMGVHQYMQFAGDVPVQLPSSQGELELRSPSEVRRAHSDAAAGRARR